MSSSPTAPPPVSVPIPYDRGGPGRTLRGGELFAFDVVLAVGLALVCGYAAIDGPDASAVGPTWLSWTVGLALGLPIAARRRYPVTVTLIVLATGATAVLTGIIPDFASAAPVVALACALYNVGVAVPRRRSIMVAVGCVTVTATTVLVASLLSRDGSDSSGVALSSLVAALAWYVGRAAGDRRARNARAALELTDLAVTNERLRIARELHDIVAHTLTVIAVKAAIANHVADERPLETREALRVIETTSREALAEMRRTLGSLRGADDGDLAPTPGLSHLPALAQRARSAGVGVDLTITPPDAVVPDGLGLAVYRIVQEALTNVVRHAGRPVTCEATVRVATEHVDVTVIDRAPATGALSADEKTPSQRRTPGEGQGIIGMRERARGYGGDFWAGSGPDGGFTVTARLPYGGEL